MRKKVEEVLIEMGVYPNLLGFDYICRAINYISEDVRLRMCEVYRLVANDVETNPTSVEKSIRHALSKIDKNGEAYKKYIGIKDTTNSAVLYTLAVKMKED